MPEYSFIVYGDGFVNITVDAPDEETAIVHALSYAGQSVPLPTTAGSEEVTVYEGDFQMLDTTGVFRFVDDGEPESEYSDDVDFMEAFRKEPGEVIVEEAKEIARFFKGLLRRREAGR